MEEDKAREVGVGKGRPRGMAEQWGGGGVVRRGLVEAGERGRGRQGSLSDHQAP